MRQVFIFAVVTLGLLSPGVLPLAANAPPKPKANAKNTAGPVTWEVPIAPGVWYPTDGPIPEKPMRYYRVRCWPGCHTGSSYGKYPHRALKGHPIFPTSTIDLHTAQSPGKK